MTRNVTINLIAASTVIVVIALIGLVTYFSSNLVNDTVVDQFRSQELQLVSSLSQQTETYFNGLSTELTNLSRQTVLNTVDPAYETDALVLLADNAEARPGIIRSAVLFDHRGEPRYIWPEDLATAYAGGERFPYSVPSRMVNRTKDGGYVAFEPSLNKASHRDYESTFVFLVPVFNDLGDTDFLVYELNLDALFEQLWEFIELDAQGQVWVIDSISTVYQVNPALSLDTLLGNKFSRSNLLSYREATIEEEAIAGRIAVIAPIRTPGEGDDFAIIVSRDTQVALDRVESDLRQIFMLAVGAIVVTAIMAAGAAQYLARETRRREAEEYRRATARTMLEISRALNSTLNLEDVLRSIMAELSNIVPYDSAAVLLLDRSKLVVAAHRGSDLTDHQVTEFDLDEAQAANQVLRTGRPLVIQDTMQDERWHSSPSSAIRAWMGVPLRVRDQTVGVLNINGHQVGHFTPEQIDMAEAFADQASVALQNARLHEVEVKQIEQELTIAREIQTSLLPQAAPDVKELEVVAVSEPARQVSGDYFQYLPMPNGQLGIAVGDVSGKGIPAAMLMAVISTAIRDEIARNARPADLLNALNARLLDRMKATHVNSALLVGIFDPQTRQMEIANGGMVQPYIRNGAKQWDFVPVGGYPLGLSQRMAYSSKMISFSPGSLLLFMSDGIVEAQNASGEMFGFDRVEAVLNSIPPDATAQLVVDTMLEATRKHLGSEEAQDDLTIMVIRSVGAAEIAAVDAAAAEPATDTAPADPAQPAATGDTPD